MGKKTKQRTKSDPENAMLDAVAAFLKNKGWNVVVIGGCQVRKQIGIENYKYEFVVGFVGGPPKQDQPTATVNAVEKSPER